MIREVLNPKKLVTKEFLAAFGDKCKELFAPNPTHTISEDNVKWIDIKTTLSYGSAEGGFDELFLNLKCVDEADVVKKAVESNIYAQSAESGIITFASGLNIGLSGINAVVFYNDHDKLNIALQLAGETKDCFVSIVACKGEKLVPSLNIITSVELVDDVEEPDFGYKQICVSPDSKPFEDSPIGLIYNQVTASTEFQIATDIDENEEYVTTPYSRNTLFTRILDATRADKLSHGLSVTYDYQNDPVEEGYDRPVGNLSENLLTLPLPDVLPYISAADGTYSGVVVSNHKITGVNNSGGISKATTVSLGGIKLGSDKTFADGDYIYLKLKEDGTAFIDKNETRNTDGGDFAYITNDEIDYLFETHVSNITLYYDEIAPASIIRKYGDIGDVFVLIASIYPLNATHQTVTWETSDDSIATIAVDPNYAKATIMFRSNGECTITCRSTSEPDITAVCHCYVGIDESSSDESE